MTLPFMEDRFAAEPMLGKLVKWLRMMGYDALYRQSYREEDFIRLRAEGRRLLSRRKEAQALHPEVILIRSDHVGEQLKETAEPWLLKTRSEEVFYEMPALQHAPQGSRS